MTTNADLDRMYEAAMAQEWEERNAGDYPGWLEAVKGIQAAVNWLHDAAEQLTTAAALVAGSSETDRISSLADEIEFLSKDLEKQAERMNRK